MDKDDTATITQAYLEHATENEVIKYWYYSPHGMAIVIGPHHGEEVVFGADDHKGVGNYLKALALVRSTT